MKMAHNNQLKRYFNPWRCQKGMTLLEATFSLGLMLLMVGVIYPLLKTSISLLDRHRDREEIVQNNRVALRQLSREARYTKTIYQTGTSIFEMGSLYLLDTNSDEDKVKYRFSNGTLFKSTDTGSGYGSEYAIAEYVQSFSSAYDSTTKVMSFSLTTTKNGKSYTGETSITMRGP